MSNDKPIGLHYSFQPIVEWDLSPGQIVVTTDPQYEVINELRFNIRNPDDQPVINFTNPDRLNPQSDLPPITAAQQWPKPIDRLYLRFPWCDKLPVQCSGMLTTNQYSTSIQCEATGSGAERWYTVPLSDPKYGRYWILFPKSTDVHLDPGESIQFKITAIITYINANTTTEIYIKPNVAGYLSTDEAVAPVHLTDPAPMIHLNSPGESVAPGSKVLLTWITLNAKNCSLIPVDGGSKDVPTQAPEGYPVFPSRTTTYTLTATNPIGTQQHASVTVHVKPVVIKSFDAVPSSAVRLGEPVQLQWRTENATFCDIFPEIGVVCQGTDECRQGSRVVTPGTFTTYEMHAEGQDGPKIAQATVFPLRTNWSSPTSDAPWTSAAKPVLFSHRLQQSPAPSLWFLTGDTSGQNWVYQSQDGVLWAPATSQAAYPPRANAAGVSFRNALWLMGGEGATGNRLNDVWTSQDGRTWVPVRGNPIWPGRSRFGCVVFQDRIWVLGGNGQSGLLSDVWSSEDGANWTKHQDNAKWSPRSDFGLGVQRGRLVVLGGNLGAKMTNQVWSSTDGVEWTQEADPSWAPRDSPNVFIYKDLLFVYGGWDGGYASDGWYSGVGGWVPLPAAPQGSIDRPKLGSGQMQGALWIAGGASQQGTPDKHVWVYAPPSDIPDTGKVFPYDQGGGGGLMTFLVECSGFDSASESFVSFTSDTRDASGQYVTLPKTKIWQGKMIVGKQAQIAANWKTNFTVKYSSNRPLPVNFKIRFMATFVGGR